MATHTFSITKAYGEAWEKTKKHIWFFVFTTIAVVVLSSLSGHSLILRWLMHTAILVSLSTLTLLIIHDKGPRAVDLTKNLATYKKPLNMFVMSIVYYSLTLLGFVFFIIPGVYIGIRLMFYPLYIMEHEHKTVSEALEDLFAITKGNFWNLFLFSALAVALNLLGILALGIGFLVTFPLTLLASGYVYKSLTPHYKR